MLKIVTSKQFRTEKKDRQRSSVNLDLDQKVLTIIQNVQQNGDEALREYTKKFDGAQLTELVLPKEQWEIANQQVDQNVIKALKIAKENIIFFHKQQRENSWFLEKEQGIMLGQKVTPLEKVGVYVPGGKAAYPSTVLMNVIPAKLAGVPSISIATPPDENGQINPYVIIAAQLAGADQIYTVGGAQAIAALAYGTETIEKVDKIVGPGNAYVARAKKWVYGEVAIDMIAGPSEICIVADETANPEYVAADLLSQAEHDEDAVPICITTNEIFAKKINVAITKQVQTAERKAIIETSLTNNGRMIIAETTSDAFNLVNLIAPEHLEIMVEHPLEKLPYIQNAGAIFLGNYSPEPLGDYVAGPNHTLPTSGTATFASPLGVYDFMKKSSIIYYTKDAFYDEANSIIDIAKAEGLFAHASAIAIRKDDVP